MPRGEFTVSQREGTVYTAHLNGVDISRCLRGITMVVEAGEAPRILLDVLVEKVDVNLTEANLWLPEPSKALLQHFGWTPPAEENP